MTIKMISALILVSSVTAHARSSDPNSLLITFKSDLTCLRAKQELSSMKLVVKCDTHDEHLKRYFVGEYVGKTSILAAMAKMKHLPGVAGVEVDQKPERLD